MKQQRSVPKTLKETDITVKIMKTIDGREICDTRCIAIRWTNSKV